MARPTDSSGTIGELIRYLLPKRKNNDVMAWPPDVFAVATYLLHRSGAYVRLVDPGARLLDKNWPATAETIGTEWRRSLEAAAASGDLGKARPPTQVKEAWSILLTGSDKSISELNQSENSALLVALVHLCGAADEACVGIGIDHDQLDQSNLTFLQTAHWTLADNDWCSLCQTVGPDKLCVLPKKHTPQRGLTIRSLSHNLALRVANELTAQWEPPYEMMRGVRDQIMNLLLFPWPESVSPRHFSFADKSNPSLSRGYGLFSYRRQTDRAFKARLRGVLDAAESIVGNIHGVVMPELALTWGEFEQALEVTVNAGTFLVTGLSEHEETTKEIVAANLCSTSFAGYARKLPKIVEPSFQHKHHRWCLDRNQVLQYGLGGRLPAGKYLWEDTVVRPREIAFHSPSPWFTISVLICEDLARQDPVAETLRAVGPNLVIALLMDAPQLRDRWPSRYASILAEDPGSSVLTLTSRGMANLSQAADGTPARNEVLALWRDAPYGIREITMPKDAAGCVLSLACHTAEEYTIDGRMKAQAHFPVFAGTHNVFVKPRATSLTPPLVRRRTSSETSKRRRRPSPSRRT